MTPFLAHISRTVDKALSYIAGETCISCSAGCGFVCEDCAEKLQHLQEPFCCRCAIPLTDVSHGAVCGRCLADPPPYTKTFAPFVYDGIIKDTIIQGKFNKKFYHFNKLFLMMGHEFRLKINELGAAQAVFPVPLSRKRLIQRGYNQSLLIASELSKILNVPVYKNSLLKIKDVPPQADLSREERFKNIKNAFSLRNKTNFDKVILVDDIITTTATVREAAKVLKKGGADEIYVFALCRTKD